jgi:hypothetical protein
MNQIMIDENTSMDYKVPLSPSDGNLIGINQTNGMVNLLFYQVRKQTGNHLDRIDITGAVLMSVQDLEKYRDAISENLENYKKREK